jgi:uncharacterized protein
MRKKILWSVIAVLLLAAVAVYVVTRPEPADTRYTNAYVLDDGLLLFIVPREGKVLRYRTMNGETGALWPVGGGQYEGGPGWAESAPVVNRIRFEMNGSVPTGLLWEKSGSPTRHAEALPLTQRQFTFKSGDLTLRGKLVLPSGTGPYATVVMVHGSEDFSGVDHYFEPYLYAANGFASLVFDKRGTGESEGRYVANFQALADDVVAAVHWLRTQNEIDGTRIHLAGFSQGGWIAPLAALKDGGIRSLLIGYGPMVPVIDEDRWGYVYPLQQQGYGEDALAKVDRINAVVADIVDRGENRWSELGRMLDESRDEPWMAAVKSGDSMLGMAAGSKAPLWMLRAYAWWKLDRNGKVPFIDRLYDPVPTAAALETPSLWIFGGEDSSMPTQWTLERLKQLQAAGKPIEYYVYPHADHGITRFEKDANGGRRDLGYEPDYFQRQIDWLRQPQISRGPT